jgi:hypothetical protein
LAGVRDEGQLTPLEAAQIAKLFEVHLHAVEVTEVTKACST